MFLHDQPQKEQNLHPWQGHLSYLEMITKVKNCCFVSVLRRQLAAFSAVSDSLLQCVFFCCQQEEF